MRRVARVAGKVLFAMVAIVFLAIGGLWTFAQSARGGDADPPPGAAQGEQIHRRASWPSSGCASAGNRLSLSGVALRDPDGGLVAEVADRRPAVRAAGAAARAVPDRRAAHRAPSAAADLGDQGLRGLEPVAGGGQPRTRRRPAKPAATAPRSTGTGLVIDLRQLEVRGGHVTVALGRAAHSRLVAERRRVGAVRDGNAARPHRPARGGGRRAHRGARRAGPGRPARRRGRLFAARARREPGRPDARHAPVRPGVERGRLRNERVGGSAGPVARADREGARDHRRPARRRAAGDRRQRSRRDGAQPGPLPSDPAARAGGGRHGRRRGGRHHQAPGGEGDGARATPGLPGLRRARSDAECAAAARRPAAGNQAGRLGAGRAAGRAAHHRPADRAAHHRASHHRQRADGGALSAGAERRGVAAVAGRPAAGRAVSALPGRVLDAGGAHQAGGGR